MGFNSLGPICFESVSAVTATNSVELGTRRTYNGEDYIYVYAQGTVSASVGATISGLSGYSVVATGLISGALCVGFAKHADIPAGSYGWLLTRGFLSSPVNGMAGSTLAAVDNVVLAADGKIAQSQTYTQVIVGRMLTTCVSGGTGGSNTGAIFVRVY